MSEQVSDPKSLRFDDFAFDLPAATLSRAGARVRLAPQPARLLALLLEHPGTVVSRDTIRRVVWGDRHVEFDQALNFAVRQLRQALGDEGTNSRFIETVPREGYRFIAAVHVVDAATRARPGSLTRVLGLAAAAVALLALGSLLLPDGAAPPLRVQIAPTVAANGDRTLAATFEAALRTALGGIEGVEVAEGSLAGARVETRLEPADSGVRVVAVLRDHPAAPPRWQTTISAAATDLPLVTADLARDIGRVLREPGSGGGTPVSRTLTVEGPAAPDQPRPR